MSARYPEQKLWDRMRKGIPPSVVRLERIENVVGEGIPDVLALAAGRVTWCELKSTRDFPKRATTRVLPSGRGLSQAQMNWHVSWRQHGGSSIVIIGVGTEALYCLSGAYADKINDWCAVELSKRSFADNWRDLVGALTDGSRI